MPVLLILPELRAASSVASAFPRNGSQHPSLCGPLATAWPDAISHGATATPGVCLLGWRKGLYWFCHLLPVNQQQGPSYFDVTPIPHLYQSIFSPFGFIFFSTKASLDM